MITTDEKKLFGKNALILTKSHRDIKYGIECDTPTGFMHCYHLFPGIDIAYLGLPNRPEEGPSLYD